MSKRNPPTESVRVPGTHITVLVTEDGTARITRLGTTHTLTEPDTASPQAAVAAWITQHVAQVEDRPIPVTITDTAGRWHVLIHPDATVTASDHGKDKPTPPARTPRRSTSRAPEPVQAADPVNVEDVTEDPAEAVTTGRATDPDRAVPEPTSTPPAPVEGGPVEDADRGADDTLDRAVPDPTIPVQDTPTGARREVGPTQPSQTETEAPVMSAPSDTTDLSTSAPTSTAEQTPDPAAAGRGRHAAPSRSFLTGSTTVDPAQHGWRGFLAKLGIKVGPSAAELSEREDTRAISQHWPGPRTIAVVNGKGGAAKTTTTALLAAFYAHYGGAGVLAFDNNETRGTLGWRTEQGPHEGHVHDLLPHAEDLLAPTARAADLAAYLHHQTQDRYDVLRSNPDLLAAEQRITQADYDSIQRLAEKYFRLIFVDSGNDESAPRWLSMVDHADQLVVPTTTRLDHAEAARLLLDALRQRDQRSADLADNAVVIVSQADREAKDAATIAAGFEGLARVAVTVPYDAALADTWLRLDALSPASRRAWLSASAQIARGL